MGWLEGLKLLFQPIGDAYKARQERKAVEHKADIDLRIAQGERAAELVRQGKADDAAWEMESLRVHGSGWKDEFVLLALYAPFLAGFFPRAHENIRAGWQALAYAPEWYVWTLPVITLAIYGIRLWRRNQSDT